jgi:hypothetical protein
MTCKSDCTCDQWRILDQTARRPHRLVTFTHTGKTLNRSLVHDPRNVLMHMPKWGFGLGWQTWLSSHCVGSPQDNLHILCTASSQMACHSIVSHPVLQKNSSACQCKGSEMVFCYVTSTCMSLRINAILLTLPVTTRAKHLMSHNSQVRLMSHSPQVRLMSHLEHIEMLW